MRADIIVICLGILAVPLTTLADAPPTPPATTQQPLPGEEITTSSGRKMRVWNTTGPVPVASAPEPWRDRGDQIDDIDVIVAPPLQGNRPDKPRPPRQPLNDGSFDVSR